MQPHSWRAQWNVLSSEMMKPGSQRLRRKVIPAEERARAKLEKGMSFELERRKARSAGAQWDGRLGGDEWEKQAGPDHMDLHTV